ncbi:MAG TPA: hypothetical protein VGD37_00800 [Kofleriaceae bacterium]
MSIADMWHEQGRAKGREEGLQEGRLAMLRRLVLLKFGGQSLDDRYEAILRAAAPDAIDRYSARLLIANSLSSVFED